MINPFLKVWTEAQEFSDKTFGTPEERGPESAILHLEKEIQEVKENPRDLEEYADLQLLVFDACRRAGYSVWDLVFACLFKTAKNLKGRDWPKNQDPSKPVFHIEKQEEQGYDPQFCPKCGLTFRGCACERT